MLKNDNIKTTIRKIKSIGGLKKIVPVEGIVFKYKGNTYKFTLFLISKSNIRVSEFLIMANYSKEKKTKRGIERFNIW